MSQMDVSIDVPIGCPNRCPQMDVSIDVPNGCPYWMSQ
uniref:Uncharacterized protein n=1 Tax=viral metagenome TaxID=1070528 RepID=A0A6C0EJ28_9ZZZZ